MVNAATQSSSRNKDKIVVLGIESTAHTFGVGIVSNYPPYILADIRYQYIPKEGGLLPREVAIFFSQVAGKAVREAFQSAGLTPESIDAFAVALGPGMGPALRVGATVARALAAKYEKPLIGVNHAVAHIEAARALTGLKDPVALYVSGGNTTVASYVDGYYRVFGETLDISLGNMLDTFAREVGLGPPYIVRGDHVVDICAEKGRFLGDLPYVVKGQDVSFSGLLTAALRLYKRRPEALHDICYTVREIGFSSVVEVTERGLAHLGKKEVVLTGGVAANRELNRKMELMVEPHGAKFRRIPRRYTGDNGVMIALTGLLSYISSHMILEPEKAYVRQRWRLDRVSVPWYPETIPLYSRISQA